mgnify:CR=1 FL=1
MIRKENMKDYATDLMRLAEIVTESKGPLANIENAHLEADDILCRILIMHGEKTAVDLFKQIKKWYA